MKVFSRFRNMTPYTIKTEKTAPFKVLSALARDLYAFDEEEGIDAYKCHDPSASARESIGLFGLEGDYVRDIEGKGVMLTIRISKKNLPARVIKDKVELWAKEQFELTGIKPGRKARKEAAEDIELELLPRAFVSHTFIPVIFTSDNRLFIFSGTTKRVDLVITFLVGILVEMGGLEWSLVKPTHDLLIGTETWMTSKALGVFDDEGDIRVTNFAVMKADDTTGKMRVSDRSLTYKEVQEALKLGWRVNQIGLHHEPSGMAFRLDDNFTLRSIVMSEGAALEFKENDDNAFDEIQAVAWLVVTEFRNIIDALIYDMKNSQTEQVEDDL